MNVDQALMPIALSPQDNRRLCSAIKVPQYLVVLAELSFQFIGKDYQRPARADFREWCVDVVHDMAQQLRTDVTVEDRMIELVPETAKAAIARRPPCQ